MHDGGRALANRQKWEAAWDRMQHVEPQALVRELLAIPEAVASPSATVPRHVILARRKAFLSSSTAWSLDCQELVGAQVK